LSPAGGAIQVSDGPFGDTNESIASMSNHRRVSATTREADRVTSATLPVLLTADEAADLLRTTRRAIYAMIERGQLPGVIRVRRRVLVHADDLLDWLDQKRAPLPKE
jgi:excisionase family DNA binding protein